MTKGGNQPSNSWAQRFRLPAIAATVALAFTSVLAVPALSASADERSDAVQLRDESRAKVNALKDEVEGIDAELAAIFSKMEQTKIDVADAQIELIDAEAELAAAQRHLTTVRAQLQEAEDELASLESAVTSSRQQESALTEAVADMARDLYRGNSVSPLQVVMSSEGTGEINSRAAAAASLGRVQSKALDQARTSLVVQENQQEKQSAVTARITTLEAEAEVAYTAAEEAKVAVQGRVDALEALLVTQKEAEAQWEARKGDAESQIAQHDAAAAAAAADIARIDAENAAKQTVIPNNRPSGGSSGSSSSSGSGSAPAPTPPASGALFAHPFGFTAPVTSYYGWRVHPIFGTLRLHDGTDFGASCGSAQLATRSGVVTGTSYDSGLGNYVTINHGLVNGQSMVTRHGHMQGFAVSVGQQVSQGQVIGYTGSTGNSTGCHLHLILFVNGATTSILNYM